MNRRTVCVCVFVAASFTARRLLLADADSAKKYLAQAKTDVANNDANAAGNDIQLAEAELDGVADADRAPIAKELTDLKKSLSDAKASEGKEKAVKIANGMLNDAKSCLDAKDSFDSSDKALQEFLAVDDNKAALGDEAVAKYLKTLSTYRKVAINNAYARNVGEARNALDAAEKEWPDKLKAMQNAAEPGDRDTAFTDFGHTLDPIERLVKNFPTDKPEAATLVARFKKLQDGYNEQVAMAKAGEVYDQLKRGWDEYTNEYEGWDKETVGPSFDELLHNQGDEMSAFKAPKTVAMIRRANSWFENAYEIDTVKQIGDKDPKIKGLIADMTKTRQAGWTKIEAFAAVILDQAEKTTITKDSRDRLETIANDDLRLNDEGSPNLKSLQSRAMKLVAAFDKKTIGDAAAQEKLYNDLVAAGNKAWPDMVKQTDATDGLDAVAALAKIDDFKGKTVRFKGVTNRMGFDYSPNGGYDFALTIDGVPCAAKFDKPLAKAFNTLTAKTGKDFSTGEYDVVAQVVGTGPIVKIARAEGTLNTTGGEHVANITSEREETVQGIRLKITAMHVGPLTGTSVQGVVDENGQVGQP